MLKDVRHLVEAGFAIHRLHPRSKRPIGEDWAARPVLTFAKLTNAYRDGENVGARLGEYSKVGGGFLHVFDLDIRAPARAAEARAKLAEMLPEYETLPSVISGSGGSSRHFYVITDRPFPSKKLAHSAEKITVSYGTVGDLHNFYENDRVATDKSTVPITKQWLQHKKRREYPNGVVFAPGEEIEGAYNHWRGFACEASDTTSCRMILSHIRKVLCQDEETSYRYLIGWLAHMIQHPGEKPGVAVVLRGLKGTGKDTLGDYVGGLFPNHHVKIASQEHLVGRFNQHQEKCLLLETVSKDRRVGSAVLFHRHFVANTTDAAGISCASRLVGDEKSLVDPPPGTFETVSYTSKRGFGLAISRPKAA